MLKLGISALALFCAVAPASADEVWTSKLGDIVYETDLTDGQMAVFKIEGARVFLPGLAGVYEGRTSYDGFWIADEGYDFSTESCGVSMVQPSFGDRSQQWGRFQVTFVDPDFPGIWVGHVSACFDDASDSVIARPLVGSEAE
ncbi:MAG: hypothetical protein AAGK23_06635 [Pseudomonadota bacterium]